MQDDRLDLERLTALLLRRTEPTTSADEHMDPETLALLERGALSDRELAEVRRHLAGCLACRRVVGEVLGGAALPAAAPFATGAGRRRQVVRFLVLAAAACFLLAAPVLWSRGGREIRFWRAERALRASDESAALAILEPMLATPGQPAAGARALASIAYERLMNEALARSEFASVESLGRQAEGRRLASTPIVNLMVQAARQIPAPLALAVVGRLDAFGVPLQAPHSKALAPPATPADRAAVTRLDATLASGVVGGTGAERAASLNAAHALLTIDPIAAKARFDAWLSSHPGDFEARLGRGLAEYLGGDPAAAATTFRALVAEDPGDLTAIVNLALALEDAGQLGEAVEEWRRVEATARDETLRARVRNRLRLLTPSGGSTTPRPGLRGPADRVESACLTHDGIGLTRDGDATRAFAAHLNGAGPDADPACPPGGATRRPGAIA